MNRSKKRLFLTFLAVIAIPAAFWSWRVWYGGPSPGTPGADKESLSPAKPNWLQAREDEADRTVWSAEIKAQQCGKVIESLWDSINASTNKLGLIASLESQGFILGGRYSTQQLTHGISSIEPSGPGPALSGGEWRPFVEQFTKAGWHLDNIEFRHNRFDTPGAGSSGGDSHFYFAARLTKQNSPPPQRVAIEGDLVVEWGATESGKAPAIKQIDASHLAIKSQAGEPAFQLVLNEEIEPPQSSPYIDPLIAYDLDGDGLSEIILAGKNLVYRRQSNGAYVSSALCQYPVERISTAVIADFDGDGLADFLCANAKGLFLFKGDAKGLFDEPGRLVWEAKPSLKGGMVLTCADIDHDGALDVFLGQYRTPTLGQVLRPYYYDANDGFPCYLLHNDGKGSFSDVTETSGLGQKRWRRIYSASLVDLDGDGNPDLVTASDFAGVDLYRNDGHGHFADVTQNWVAESHGFGMGHALADFNADGRLDLLVIGMPSATADRLEHLGLRRAYGTDDARLRPAMTFGNRVYLARAEGGGFEQTAMNDTIARSGWSWGCSAFDFDNDGFPDVYIANGLQTRESVRDYEAEFWLHDMFVDEKVDDVIATKYFMEKFSRTRGRGWSYGGWEKNRLYLNQEGKSFLEIGHLAGVALEADSRCVVTDDLDGDGRMDLLVTTQEAWPKPKQTLKIYKNNLPDAGHWIGFRFREEGSGKSPVGVRVTIHYGGRTAVRQIVAGDSHRSQHSNTIHFGLGAAESIDKAEIAWLGGSTVTLLNPPVNKYHRIHAPAERPSLKQ